MLEPDSVMDNGMLLRCQTAEERLESLILILDEISYDACRNKYEIVKKYGSIENYQSSLRNRIEDGLYICTRTFHQNFTGCCVVRDA